MMTFISPFQLELMHIETLLNLNVRINIRSIFLIKFFLLNLYNSMLQCALCMCVDKFKSTVMLDSI